MLAFFQSDGKEPEINAGKIQGWIAVVISFETRQETGISLICLLATGGGM